MNTGIIIFAVVAILFLSLVLGYIRKNFNCGFTKYTVNNCDTEVMDCNDNNNQPELKEKTQIYFVEEQIENNDHYYLTENMKLEAFSEV